MQQFFIDDIDNPSLSDDQHHQIKNVLRMKQNDTVRLVDAKGNGVLARFNTNALDSFDILEPLTFYKKKYRIRIVASLIRSERLEWMIQKACECGVDEIILYRSDRGVVRDFGKREARKLERLQLIAKEASEQSYRQFPVSVSGIIESKDLKSTLSDFNLYGDTSDHPHLLSVLNKSQGSITVFIGPEGGFSDKERALFDSLNIQAVSFGPYIYRAETAPLAVATLISTLEIG
ncbi:16S rRNA methyltransferase [Erysipelothrix larvae]|uniref:Ribosomal RNA small subunit methyltransferase E n=1 Tax=Erysipelothrix larvae TaxID=1514105 RepID=A0A120JTN4_9FIRM|nr:RsmE family RNA methyltransferase [Erysipelothrix larvae]AMC93390.1 16S rRNA methyltransferase [Erysipelothrix larvae]